MLPVRVSQVCIKLGAKRRDPKMRNKVIVGIAKGGHSIKYLSGVHLNFMSIFIFCAHQNAAAVAGI